MNQTHNQTHDQAHQPSPASETTTKLGITRSQDELTEVIARGAGLGVSVVPLPLFRYVTVEFPLTSAELASIDWLCFTSARGVERFFQALEKRSSATSPHTKFAVVGTKTATALQAQGKTADIQPQATVGEALFEELRLELSGSGKSGCNVAYVGAEVVRFDPVNLFADADVNYRKIVVYRAERETLSHESVQCFSQDDSIVFTSPKAAEEFDRLFGPPKTRIVAIGGITAEAIEDIGWEEPEILTEPDLEMALEHVLRHRRKVAGNE
jgi:uroporphyrinogen-III synthase